MMRPVLAEFDPSTVTPFKMLRSMPADLRGVVTNLHDALKELRSTVFRAGQLVLADGQVATQAWLEGDVLARMLPSILQSGFMARDDEGARRQQGGVASVFGKGNKTRAVQVPAKLYKQLVALRVDSGPDAPVVPGHDGRPLSHDAAHRIVKRAARRAGLSGAVSAHWLRHAHASHALDNNAPVHVVQATLGHASLATTTRYSHVREGDGSANYLD